ncbi:hypothetical protein ABG79_00753 [Caloramator mitchellensis]|uniref:TIGR02680 family protein n=1 Tax=Caloramator mitchellensis TaxID=908809 RepID=A0A0R3JV17_CALMK|nr:TIGR02680 family protein [Caloramator mitchellensis]KRQ87415.1 hypothetical protein ABG79_00753 [Caloramator mitchellensis]
MNQNRWIIERAGLANFWYYDEEEFTFSDGRLLLRGSNGSGKSVTMQSFIPLLLDGNKSPERLDPFGSKARRLENYLLGDDEDGDDERTGYLYMEFKKKDTGNYLTIGMGFKAQRGKPIQSWGFSITDGRRIGHNFYLYKNIGEKIPLTKKELENRISTGGKVVETQGDYMKMVNDLLFGFSDIDEYDELIKLLVQLRSPKLSKDFRPTVIYEIMENSLQPLSEDDLRPMSEAIENMDNIKSRLDELKESKKAADRIKDAYDKYNKFILIDKAKSFILSNNELEKLIKDKKELEQKRDYAKQEFQAAEKKIEEYSMLIKSAEDKKRQLEVHDSLKIKEKIHSIEDLISNYKKEKHLKQNQLDLKKSRERKLYSEIKELSDKHDILIKKLDAIVEEMDEYAVDFAFDEQEFLKDEIKANADKNYDFNFVNDKFKKHYENIENARELLKELDRINKEYDKILKELESKKQERITKEKRVEDSKLLLIETKEELNERIYAWKNSNKEFIPSQDVLISCTRTVNQFNQKSSFDDIIKIIREEYNHFEGELIKERANLQFEKQQEENKLNEIKSEIAEWRNKKDPEPERDERVIRNRQRLEKEGIPFIPLYKSVDFKDIPQEIMGRVEEALNDMGLLDALIVPSKFKDKIFQMDKDMADKYIFPTPQILMHDISEFLKPDKIDVNGITEKDITDVIQSILIDENNSTYINEKGEYQIGILKGKTSSSCSPKFIGSSARKRYREEKINELETIKRNIEEKIIEKEEQIQKINQRIATLKSELNKFPKGDDLLTAIKQLQEAEYELERIIKDVELKEKEERTIYEKLKHVQQSVYELTHKINLKADIEIYEEAIASAKKYRDLLHSLEKLHIDIMHNNEQANSKIYEREEIEQDVQNLIDDITSLDRKLRENEINLSNLFEQLKLSNIDEIEKEIDECLNILKTYPVEKEKEIDKRARNHDLYTRAIEELGSINKKINEKGKIVDIFKQSFIEEYKLGFIEEAKEDEPIKIAHRLVREIKIDEKQKDDYISNLYQKFQENNQHLREYIVKIDSLFDREIEADDEEIKAAFARAKRHYLTGKVRGKDVDFYALIDFIKEGIEENEKLLKESDRQLFEDILVNNISKKIRAKIYHSEQWVKKMNELMEKMDTSSGLSFSLRWTSKKAEGENQLDTKELVDLLKQEGSIMKESDLNKLSEHFRSKIADARRIQEDSGKSVTFHSIMKEILDYRKWFEFKLYFQRMGQNKKELTNNAFYQFSGGEKAMAMYVPLFSAVYARYLGARGDCPRIISLDEAFAGVDEKNIRDMFRLLRDLNLDFVINSQILWGDYDTVPSLAICELLRPENADFVTVIRYHWNGKTKELVS